MFYVALAKRTGEVLDDAEVLEFADLKEAINELLRSPAEPFVPRYLHPMPHDPTHKWVERSLNQLGSVLVVFMDPSPPLVPKEPQLLHKKIWVL